MEPRDAAPMTAEPAAGDVAAGQGSAPRRTWLAAERTYLAWLRTALGALGLALAVGRLIPALIHASHVTFGLLGAGFGILGILLVAIGAYRAVRVRAALAAGLPVPEDFWTAWLLTAVVGVLAVATIVLVFAEV